MARLAEEILNEVRALVSALEEFDRQNAAAHGINVADMRCIELLARIGTMQPKDIATALGYTSGGITAVIDRLEAQGYVLRKGTAADHRCTLVSITQLARRHQTPWVKILGEYLNGIPNDELEKVLRGFRILGSSVQSYARRVRSQRRMGL